MVDLSKPDSESTLRIVRDIPTYMRCALAIMTVSINIYLHAGSLDPIPCLTNCYCISDL